MMALPAEATGVHPRLLKCTLEVETSRAGLPEPERQTWEALWQQIEGLLRGPMPNMSVPVHRAG